MKKIRNISKSDKELLGMLNKMANNQKKFSNFIDELEPDFDSPPIAVEEIIKLSKMVMISRKMFVKEICFAFIRILALPYHAINSRSSIDELNDYVSAAREFYRLDVWPIMHLKTRDTIALLKGVVSWHRNAREDESLGSICKTCGWKHPDNWQFFFHPTSNERYKLNDTQARLIEKVHKSMQDNALSGSADVVVGSYTRPYDIFSKTDKGKAVWEMLFKGCHKLPGVGRGFIWIKPPRVKRRRGRSPDILKALMKYNPRSS